MTQPVATPNAPVLPHILVVDDDPAIRDLLVEYLGANELRATAVASGREMLALLDREVIDLVVLDLKLPGEDGIQHRQRAARARHAAGAAAHGQE